MTTLIIKKEICENITSHKGFKVCKFKLTAKILKFYWKRKGYEIEELEE